MARPIPKMWIDSRSCKVKDTSSVEEMRKMALFKAVAADLKPYFFIYRYDHIKAKYDKYNKSVASNCKIRFGKSLAELQNSEILTQEEAIFLENYEKYLPISIAPGVMNRICWKIEDAFQSMDVLPGVEFDRSVLKSNAVYTQEEYDAIKQLYDEYNKNMQLFLKGIKKNESLKEERDVFMAQLVSEFSAACAVACPNVETLANILVDLCYTSDKNKSFAWEVAGEQIYQNVLKNCNNVIRFPVKVEDGEFEFAGEMFNVVSKTIGGENDDFE